MNCFTFAIRWVGFFWRPGLRVIEDRSFTPPKLVGMELLLLGFNLGAFAWNFKISNYQAGCHVAKSYFGRIIV